jgi:hypothetical protein
MLREFRQKLLQRGSGLGVLLQDEERGSGSIPGIPGVFRRAGGTLARVTARSPSVISILM